MKQPQALDPVIGETPRMIQCSLLYLASISQDNSRPKSNIASRLEQDTGRDQATLIQRNGALDSSV